MNLIDIQYMHLNEKGLSENCGYCAGKKENPGSATWGLGSPRLSVVDYQKMMDRGFRRCGTYIYKYDLEQSCCQPYTIRLNVDEWQISQSQKKVEKKFYKFLENGRQEHEVLAEGGAEENSEMNVEIDPR